MTRDELEAVAMAIGICKVPLTPLAPQSECYAVRDRSGNWRAFDPERDIGDCSHMCAALRIDTNWSDDAVCCGPILRPGPHAIERFSNHEGCRLSAWRTAACEVAVKLMEGK